MKKQGARAALMPGGAKGMLALDIGDQGPASIRAKGGLVRPLGL